MIAATLLILPFCSTALAGGMFGPPQTISKEAGGLNTAVGFRYYQDTFQNEADYVVRQQQIYSQVAYGASGIWEIYGRLGIADLKIGDAFNSSIAGLTTSKNDFEENWKFFGTIGAKGFYPFNKTFGIGAFLQGSYNFSNFTDDVAGTSNGQPYVTDLKIKNLWDVHGGLGLQAAIPYGIKLYAGPYLYYAEADSYFSPPVPGLQAGEQKVIFKNKSLAGGFFGADVALGRGFRLNVEGQYTGRLSAGAAITYVY